MTDEDRDYSNEEVAHAYHSYTADHSREHFWAVEIAVFLPIEKRWEELWDLILALCATVSTNNRAKELAVVGAGPLEDLLLGAGPAFIERIEAESIANHNFAVALTGVWPREIEPSVWNRVVRVCRSVPDPLDTPYAF